MAQTGLQCCGIDFGMAQQKMTQRGSAVIEYFGTNGTGTLVRLEHERVGCLVMASAPTSDELAFLAQRYGLRREDLQSALDPDEVSRIDAEADYLMVMLDTPIHDSAGGQFSYKTIPFATFITEDNVVTVCAEKDAPFVSLLARARTLPHTSETNSFAARVLIASSTAYLVALRVINQERKKLMSQQGHPSRKQLNELYLLDASLVYFKTSLTTNDNVLERQLRLTRNVDQDLRDVVEDVVIENRQALENARIFSEMLDSAIDHFALLMDHELNRTMQVMAVVTLVMSVPTVVAGFFGMNVPGIPLDQSPVGFGVVVAVTMAASAALLALLRRAHWF